MKKIINLFLLALVAFTFSACSNDAGSSSESDENLVVDTNTLYTVTFHFNFPEQTKTSTTYYEYFTDAQKCSVPSDFDSTKGGDYTETKQKYKNQTIYFIRSTYSPYNCLAKQALPAYEFYDTESENYKDKNEPEYNWLFKSWNTKADGSGTNYEPTINDKTGIKYIVKGNVDLYAQYELYSYEKKVYYEALEDSNN